MVKSGLVFVSVYVLVFMVGCGLFGIREDNDGKKTSDGTGGIFGTLLNYVIPGSGALVAAGAGVYCDMKRRQWKSAATSSMQAIEQYKGTPDGAAVWDGLKKKLGESHATAKIKDFVDVYLSKLRG